MTAKIDHVVPKISKSDPFVDPTGAPELASSAEGSILDVFSMISVPFKLSWS